MFLLPPNPASRKGSLVVATRDYPGERLDFVLTEKQIAKFQELYLQKFGKAISREAAYEQALKLVRLFALVYKPITPEQLEEAKAKQKEINN